MKKGSYEYFGAGQYKVFTGEGKNEFIICDSKREVNEEIEKIKNGEPNASEKS